MFRLSEVRRDLQGRASVTARAHLKTA